MGQYFNNETLDALWVRLVNATEEITSSSLSNAGIKGIHDALLSHYGLSHENTPTTPGDYIKGIAVAARCKKYGTTKPDMLWSLEQIVEELEDTTSTNIIVTLSQDGIASSNITTDPDWDLYNAETDELIHTVQASCSPVDFSSHMTSGNQYYVIVLGVRSNTITYNGTTAPEYSCTLSQEGILTLHSSASEYGYDLYENGVEIASNGADSRSSWNLSSHMTPGNEYYATGKWGDYIDEDFNMEYHYADSNTIVYGGGSGPRDLSVDPDAYLTNEGRVYISNYAGPEWDGLEAYITYYYNGAQNRGAIFILGADGHLQDCYLDSAAEWSYELSLHDRTNNGDSHTNIVQISKST